MVRHNWDEIRAEYVTGSMSYAELAERHHMTKTQVGKQARKDDWPGQRAAYRKSVTGTVIRKKRYKDSEKLAGLMDAADKLVEHIQRMMDDDNQFRRNVDSTFVKDESGAWVHKKQEFLTSKVDTKALGNAARALNDATRAVRDLYNIPTQAERDRKKLEERKLKLLEDKDKPIGGEDTGVIYLGQPQPEDPDAVEVE